MKEGVLLIVRRTPIDPMKLYNVPEKFRRVSDKTQKHFLGTLRVDTSVGISKEELCTWIWKNYGPGEYSILGISRRVPRKKFSHTFICLGYGCRYYKDASCKIWKRHTKGMACKMNSRYCRNWMSRGRVVVEKRDTKKGFEARWLHRYDKMHYIRWFKK